MRVPALKMVVVLAVALPMLSACADRSRPLDDDGQPFTDDRGSPGRGGGGGQGVWAEALRTATQIGMGFLHH